MAVAALLGTSSASATSRTLTFDDVAPGSLTVQYASQGVEFQKGRTPANHGNATVKHVPATARSGDQAVWMGCNNVEICPADTWAAFSVQQATVSVYVGGDGSGIIGATVPVKMTAYDLGGNQVAESTVTVDQGERVDRLASVSSAAGDIRSVHLASALSFLYLDDFTFDVPETTPPPGPDFAVGIPGGTGLTLSPGGVARATVRVTRVNDSTGALSLSASDLPSGITANFEPNPATGGDGSEVLLTLTAASDTPAADRAPVSITATPDGPAAGPGPHSFVLPLTVPAQLNGFDLRLKGIEVTQGIQSPGFLLPTFLSGDIGQYRGLRLVDGGRTIVRVYADALSAPAGGVPAGVLLYGRDEKTNRSLPDGPLGPIAGPESLAGSPFPGVGPADRTSRTGAYSFELPPEWTHGSIRLKAVVLNPPPSPFGDQPIYEECAGCGSNNSYTLLRVRFTPTRPFVLDVLELATKNSVGPLGPLEQVFSAPLAWLPTGGRRFVLRGPRDVVRNHDDDLNAQVQKWWDTNPDSHADAAIGVENLNAGDGGGQTWTYTAIASAGRPFTALSHELGHLLGRGHASAACGGANPAQPPGDGNVYDSWPPDNEGLLQGIALDRRLTYGPQRPFNIIAADVPNTGDKAYDFMSYCAGESNSWLSPQGWEAVIDRLKVAQTASLAPRRSLSLAAGPLLAVTAQVTDATRFKSLTPVDKRPATSGEPSPYRLRALDPAGRVLSDVALAAQDIHADPGGSSTLLSGAVPAKDVAQLDIARGNQVLASKRRGGHAPRIRLLTPAAKRRTRIRGRGNVTVRWHASDADGDPLDVNVDYSLDGGRHWQTLALDANPGATRIPARLFARTRNGRVRVIATDGFDRARARSGPIVSAGVPPTVSITAPTRRVSVPGDGTVVFRGEAVDDRFTRIPGSRMRWIVGRRPLGRGAELAVTGTLPAGRRTIRLVARDRAGRRGTASVRVSVVPVVPRFLTLTAPRRLRIAAHAVRLGVRSSCAATLRVAGRRFAVSRQTTRVLVPVKPKRRKLTLRLRLDTGGGRATTQTVTIRRS